MVVSKHLLIDRQRALVERFGGGGALVLEKQGQVVQAAGGVGMLRPQHWAGLLTDRPCGIKASTNSKLSSSIPIERQGDRLANEVIAKRGERFKQIARRFPQL